MAGKKYTHIRNVIASQSSGPSVSGYSEEVPMKSGRRKNLVQGKLREGSGDEPPGSW
jgi:hypothetical protein